MRGRPGTECFSICHAFPVGVKRFFGAMCLRQYARRCGCGYRSGDDWRIQAELMFQWAGKGLSHTAQAKSPSRTMLSWPQAGQRPSRGWYLMQWHKARKRVVKFCRVSRGNVRVWRHGRDDSAERHWVATVPRYAASDLASPDETVAEAVPKKTLCVLFSSLLEVYNC